ncbi:MAG TPA: hypothetical protein VGH27_19300 [Streptosporangiaceae bacterium]
MTAILGVWAVCGPNVTSGSRASCSASVPELAVVVVQTGSA